MNTANKPRLITETEDIYSFLPDGLAQAITYLQNKLDAIPQAYRESAELDIEHEEGWGLRISIQYKRPETQEERKLRTERETVRRQRQKARERELYQELKQKFRDS